MNNEKIKTYSYTVVAILATLILLYLSFTKVLSLLLPFLISWAVAFAVRPLSHKISSHTKIPYRWVSLVISLLCIIAVLSLIFGIIVYAAREAWSLLTKLAADERIYDIISKIMNPLAGIFGEGDGAAEIEAKLAEAVRGLISSLLTRFVNFATDFVSFIPGVIIFLLISIISCVYFSLDLDNINKRMRELLPQRISEWLISFKNKFLIAAISYLRSYLVIMFFVFLILLVGFLLMRVEYAILLAVIFALLDMLPLIGIGTFMIPWAVVEIILGNAGIGIGLIVLFAVTEVTRNLIEPKIVGKNLGLHPILTLVILYFSYSLFGIAGLFLTPLITVILNIVFEKKNSPEVT